MHVEPFNIEDVVESFFSAQLVWQCFYLLSSTIHDDDWEANCRQHRVSNIMPNKENTVSNSATLNQKDILK